MIDEPAMTLSRHDNASKVPAKAHGNLKIPIVPYIHFRIPPFG